jgi:hypothetical protein
MVRVCLTMTSNPTVNPCHGAAGIRAATTARLKPLGYSWYPLAPIHSISACCCIFSNLPITVPCRRRAHQTSTRYRTAAGCAEW